VGLAHVWAYITLNGLAWQDARQGRTEHPDYADRRHGLAVALAGLGRRQEARAHLERAAQLMEAALGVDDPEAQALRTQFEEFDQEVF